MLSNFFNSEADIPTQVVVLIFRQPFLFLVSSKIDLILDGADRLGPYIPK